LFGTSRPDRQAIHEAEVGREPATSPAARTTSPRRRAARRPEGPTATRSYATWTRAACCMPRAMGRPGRPPIARN